MNRTLISIITNRTFGNVFYDNPDMTKQSIFQFLKQLPVAGIQVSGIGHPLHPFKPPGQYISSSPQGIGHTLGHFTPSIPSGAIFHEMIKCFTC
jgi:hypothetical protein